MVHSKWPNRNQHLISKTPIDMKTKNQIAYIATKFRNTALHCKTSVLTVGFDYLLVIYKLLIKLQKLSKNQCLNYNTTDQCWQLKANLSLIRLEIESGILLRRALVTSANGIIPRKTRQEWVTDEILLKKKNQCKECHK